MLHYYIRRKLAMTVMTANQVIQVGIVFLIYECEWNQWNKILLVSLKFMQQLSCVLCFPLFAITMLIIFYASNPYLELTSDKSPRWKQFYRQLMMFIFIALRSKGQGKKMYCIFQNLTGKKIELYQIDAHSKVHRLIKLKDGKKERLEVYEGDVFVAGSTKKKMRLLINNNTVYTAMTEKEGENTVLAHISRGPGNFWYLYTLPSFNISDTTNSFYIFITHC